MALVTGCVVGLVANPLKDKVAHYRTMLKWSRLAGEEDIRELIHAQVFMQLNKVCSQVK